MSEQNVAEIIAENKRLVNRQKLTLNDYTSLYRLCEELLRQYKNNENIKAGFEKLEQELNQRMPCPF